MLFLAVGLGVLLFGLSFWMSVIAKFRLRTAALIVLSLLVFMSNMLYLDVVSEIGDYYSDIFCFHCLSEVGISDTICRRCRGNISTTDNIALRHRELQCNCVRGRVPYSTKVCDRCGREYEKVDFYTPVVNFGITNSLELWLALHKSFVQMLYSGTVCMIACNIVWIHHCKRKRRVTENEQ